MKPDAVDRSNGYEGVAADFIASRGRAPQTAIGVAQVRDWARALPRGAAVLDLGCGPGVPIAEALLAEGLDVYGIDASPSFVAAFRQRFPRTPVMCEPVDESPFFGRPFDAVLAWGLLFLLPADEQRRLIAKVADALVPGGRFLFTSPAQTCAWNDILTGLESRSLGAAEYGRLSSASGLAVLREYEDVGQNHYYECVSRRPRSPVVEMAVRRSTYGCRTQ
jgi:SAM-dependent methyltransferase